MFSFKWHLKHEYDSWLFITEKEKYTNMNTSWSYNFSFFCEFSFLNDSIGWLFFQYKLSFMSCGN